VSAAKLCASSHRACQRMSATAGSKRPVIRSD
jgi:hypothetical protein